MEASDGRSVTGLWAHKCTCSHRHNFCSVIIAHVQASHDEAYAKCSDSKVSMKIEPHMVLKDDSGLVCYKLSVIIFRTGGLNIGHFYNAAPAKSGMWRIINNQTAQEAMSLKQLQFSEGYLNDP